MAPKAFALANTSLLVWGAVVVVLFFLALACQNGAGKVSGSSERLLGHTAMLSGRLWPYGDARTF
jgi:hypothetical protein